MFAHLSVNDQINWEDEDSNCSVDKVDDPYTSTSGGKDADQEAKEDEDEEDAEHEAAQDGEVNPGLEGEGGEDDDDACSGCSCNEHHLSFIELQNVNIFYTDQIFWLKFYPKKSA